MQSKQKEIERPRQAFNAFLKQYPLCFGYWKKVRGLQHFFVLVRKAMVTMDGAFFFTPTVCGS